MTSLHPSQADFATASTERADAVAIACQTKKSKRFFMRRFRTPLSPPVSTMLLRCLLGGFICTMIAACFVHGDGPARMPVVRAMDSQPGNRQAATLLLPRFQSESSRAVEKITHFQPSGATTSDAMASDGTVAQGTVSGAVFSGPAVSGPAVSGPATNRPSANRMVSFSAGGQPARIIHAGYQAASRDQGNSHTSSPAADHGQVARSLDAEEVRSPSPNPVNSTNTNTEIQYPEIQPLVRGVYVPRRRPADSSAGSTRVPESVITADTASTSANPENVENSTLESPDVAFARNGRASQVDQSNDRLFVEDTPPVPDQPTPVQAALGKNNPSAFQQNGFDNRPAAVAQTLPAARYPSTARPAPESPRSGITATRTSSPAVSTTHAQLLPASSDVPRSTAPVARDSRQNQPTADFNASSEMSDASRIAQSVYGLAVMAPTSPMRLAGKDASIGPQETAVPAPPVFQAPTAPQPSYPATDFQLQNNGLQSIQPSDPSTAGLPPVDPPAAVPTGPSTAVAQPAQIFHSAPAHASQYPVGSGVSPGMSGFRATVEADAPRWLDPYQQRTAWQDDNNLQPNMPPSLYQMPTDFFPWWDSLVRNQMGIAPASMPVDATTLVQKAMQYSPQILALQAEPEVQQRIVWQEEAQFDWRSYLETTYDDLNDPVGSRLTTGDNSERFSDTRFNASGGLRKRTTSGGELEIGQRIGHQYNNSTFLIPNPQSTSRLELSFRQPIWSQAGAVYNQSQIVLARIATNTASDEVLSELQSHLYQVTEAYWQLYRSRAEFFQRQKLVESSQSVLRNLDVR